MPPFADGRVMNAFCPLYNVSSGGAETNINGVAVVGGSVTLTNLLVEPMVRFPCRRDVKTVAPPTLHAWRVGFHVYVKLPERPPDKAVLSGFTQSAKEREAQFEHRIVLQQLRIRDNLEQMKPTREG